VENRIAAKRRKNRKRRGEESRSPISTTKGTKKGLAYPHFQNFVISRRAGARAQRVVLFVVKKPLKKSPLLSKGSDFEDQQKTSSASEKSLTNDS
jgi:hypothetical protein